MLLLNERERLGAEALEGPSHLIRAETQRGDRVVLEDGRRGGAKQLERRAFRCREDERCHPRGGSGFLRHDRASGVPG